VYSVLAVFVGVIMHRYLLPFALAVDSLLLMLSAFVWELWPLVFLSGICALMSFFAFTTEEF
jgi:hypothetical protein